MVLFNWLTVPWLRVLDAVFSPWNPRFSPIILCGIFGVGPYPQHFGFFLATFRWASIPIRHAVLVQRAHLRLLYQRSLTPSLKKKKAGQPLGPSLPLWGSLITFRHTTLGRTPLDEWSAHRRDLDLATHNIHKRQTSVPPAGFEPAIPASERSQTHAFNREATGICLLVNRPG